MKKVVINNCFGGFGLSYEGILRYAELKGIKLYAWLDDISKNIYKEKAVLGNPQLVHHWCTIEFANETEYKEYIKKHPKNEDSIYFTEYDIDRDDSALIQVVNELSKKANGRCAELKIIEIPDDIEYQIEEYDGNEHIAEKHKTWF